ncbi:MAG: (Fe-S)-binding protein, partial [Candidatus Korarchaeota archaeon]|nr:(Fe-S)-binding protein [Candidatus Korarchaeota archaeon]
MIDFLKDMFMERVAEIESRLREEFSPDLRITVEEPGVRVLYVPLAGEHTIAPAAKIFHAAGESWTLSLFTASNYGFFLGDAERAKKVAQNIVEEAKRLGVSVVAFPECGHATRTLLKFWDGWFGDLPFEKVSILQLIDQYLRDGRIKLREGVIEEPISYHDPCNLGRNTGLYEQPRRVLRIVAKDFRELSPRRERNWCCGGGGGLVAVPEMKEVRMMAGRKKAEQIR